MFMIILQSPPLPPRFQNSRNIVQIPFQQIKDTTETHDNWTSNQPSNNTKCAIDHPMRRACAKLIHKSDDNSPLNKTTTESGDNSERTQRNKFV